MKAISMKDEDLSESVTIVKLDSLMDAYELQQQAKEYEALAKSKKAKAQSIIERYVSANVRDEDRCHIHETIRRTRIIDLERFKALYPHEFMEIAEVPVSKAESEIGKKRLEDVCKVIEKSVYTVQYAPEFD